MALTQKKHSHYHKDVSHLTSIDIYRFCDLFDVRGPLEHALKKIACAGGRGDKDYFQDLREAIDSIERAIEMRKEDEQKPNHQQV